jgi:DHA1 family multidrug resistance protein-like MFS transporter
LGWRGQLGALWLGQLISALAFSFALPFLPLYIQTLGVADPAAAGLWAGASSAAFSVVMAALGPVWGSLADRYGPRLMVGRALFGGALVIGSMGFVRTVYELFALRVIQGGITGVQAAVTVLVTGIVPRDRLAWSVGLLQVATFSGASVGPLIGGIIADRLGYRAAFVATGVLMSLSGLVIFLGVPGNAGTARGTTRVTIRRSLRWAIASPAVVSMVVILFLLQFASTVVSPVLPLFVKELSNDPESVASTVGLLFGVAGFFGAISAAGAGRVADVLGHKQVVVAAALGSALLYAPQALVTSTEQLLLLRLGVGIFSGALIPSTQAIIGIATPPERRGVAFGIAASAASLGSAAGPLLGAGIAATWGIRVVFLVTAGLLLVATLVVVKGVRE